MTRWRVLALVAVATLVPALTVAVVLADLPDGSRTVVLDALGGAVLVLGLGLIVLVGMIGWIACAVLNCCKRECGRLMAALRQDPVRALASGGIG